MVSREVADAFISVHGDLSPFRKDLNKANEQMEALAIDAADTFTDAWGERVGKQIGKEWNSVIDAMYSGNQLEINQMVASFDSSDLNSASEKIHALLADMQIAGKLTEDQYQKVIESVDASVKAQQRQYFAEQDLAKDRAKWNEAHLRMMEGLAHARKRDTDQQLSEFSQMQAIQDRYNDSFEAMVRNNRLTDLTADFKAMARAASEMNWSKMAAGFENMEAFRNRIAEVNSEMLLLGRISEDNAKRISSDVDAWIAQEQERKRVLLETAAAQEQALNNEKALRERNKKLLSEASAAALAEAKALREEQERFNRSLDGMTQAAKLRLIERDYRALTEAIASGDWSNVAKGSHDLNDMRENVARVLIEMHRLGRISDAEFGKLGAAMSKATADAKKFNIEFEKTTRTGDLADAAFSAATRSGRSFGTMLTNLGRASQGLREHLQGFAGLNVFGDMLREGLDFIHNLDRIAVSTAKATLLMGSMAAVGGTALAGLVTIAADVGKALAGISAVLPAFVTGAGIMIGVMVAALKDLKTELADLGPAWTKLQDTISTNFWAKAEAPIRNLNTKLFPTLQKQLDITATRMGELTGAFADAFADAATPERVTVMFERMNNAISIAKGAMAPLTRAFVNLGETGSKYFERFGTWIVKLSDQFDTFIQNAVNSGDLDRWIEAGIAGFEDMGRSLDGMIGIFNAIDTAARAAGIGGLSEFADKLQGAAAIMQGPAFQKGLTELLSGMADAVSKIGTALYDLGPALASIMPFVEQGFKDIGTAAATLIGYIGQVLEDPAVHLAMLNFTGSIVTAMEKLAPAVAPFSASLAQALDLLGKILINTAEVAAAFAVNVMPVLDTMSAKMGTLLDPLKNSAIAVIEAMKPVLEAIDKSIVGPLITAIDEKILPAFDKMVKAWTPEFVKIIQDLGPAFTAVADAFAKALDFGGQLAPVVSGLVGFLTPTFVATVTATGDAFSNLAEGLKKANDAFDEGPKPTDDPKSMPWSDIFATFTTEGIHLAIGQVWTEKFWPEIVKSWESVLNGNFGSSDLGAERWNEFVSRPIQGFKDAVGNLDAEGGFNETVNKWFDDTIFKPIREGWDNAFKGLDGWWKDVKKGFQEWMSGILGFDTVFNSDDASVSGGGAGGKGTSIGGKIEEAWQMEDMSFMDKFKEAVRIKWEEFWAGIQEKLTSWGETIKTNWTTFWDGVGAKVREIWDGVVLWIQTKAAEIKTNLDAFIADTKTNWTTFWDGVKLKVEEIWNAVKTWIDTKVAEVKTAIDTFITDTRTNWDNFWNGIKTKVEETWNSIKTWIDTKTTEVKTNIDNFIRDVKTNWETFWRELPQKVRDGWDKIVREFQTGVDRAVEWVKSLPGKIVTAIGSGWDTLVTQGKAIMDGFKRGLESAWEGVKSFVGGIATWIAEHKGPLSYDRVLLRPAGQAIMDGLGVGLRSQLPALLATLNLVTATMADTLTATFAKSKMYLAGAEAALGLADGLKANKSAVIDAFGSLLPGESTVTVGAGLGGAVPPAAGNTTIINVAEGAIPISTPTENPEIVASKVIDGLANSISNF